MTSFRQGKQNRTTEPSTLVDILWKMVVRHQFVVPRKNRLQLRALPFCSVYNATFSFLLLCVLTTVLMEDGRPSCTQWTWSCVVVPWRGRCTAACFQRFTFYNYTSIGVATLALGMILCITRGMATHTCTNHTVLIIIVTVSYCQEYIILVLHPAALLYEFSIEVS